MDGPFVEAEHGSVSNLRQQLRKNLRTDTDFVAFILDHFPAVYQHMSDGMDRVGKENLLFAIESPDAIATALNSTNVSMPQSAVRISNKKGRYQYGLLITLPILLLVTYFLWMHRKDRANPPTVTSSASVPAISHEGNVSANPKPPPDPRHLPDPTPAKLNLKPKPRTAGQPKRPDARKLTTDELIEELDRPPPDY